MDGIAIGLGSLIAVSVVVFVARPWWSHRARGELPWGLDIGPRAALAERREAVLTALRDLDFDRAVGKLTEEDYGSLRQALLVEAAEVTALLDEERAGGEDDLDAHIEAEVLAVRQALHADRQRITRATGGPCPACGRLSRPGDLYCGGCGAQLQGACPACGRAIRAADLFCVGCGAVLAPAVSREKLPS